MMSNQIAIGKYDQYKATLQFYSSSIEIFKGMIKFDHPEEQHKIIESLLRKVNELGLTGNQFSREVQLEKVINYCTASLYAPAYDSNYIPIVTLRSKLLDIQNTHYTKDKNFFLVPPNIVSSTGNIRLELDKYSIKYQTTEVEKLIGIHISINPTSFLKDGQMKAKQQLQEEISNDLTKFYSERKRFKKNPKSGFFCLFSKEEQSKYRQIISFFESKSVNCISFDFMFDGEKFKRECGQLNPFNQYMMHCLNLSINHAFASGTFSNPQYKSNINSEKLQQIKEQNHFLIRWKAYKNLHLLLELIANSERVKDLQIINLSGLALSQDVVKMLSQILQKGNVKYLDLGGCQIARQSLQHLKSCLQNSFSLDCVVLDDLVYYVKFVKKNCFGAKTKSFIYQRLSDDDYSSLLEELVFNAKNLKEVYMNWDKSVHKNRYYSIPSESLSEEITLQQIVQKENVGPIGKKCYERIYQLMMGLENMKVIQARNQQLPFELIQNYAISIREKISFQNLEVDGNVELDYLHDVTCCCGCYSFLEKYLSCCISCCSGINVEDISRRQVLDSVINDIRRYCQFNFNSPKFESQRVQLKNKYITYKKHLDETLQKQIQDQKDLLLKLQQEKDRLEQQRKKELEEEHQRQLELNNARASKHLVVTQMHHEGSLTNIGNSVQAIKSLETIPLQIGSKDSQQNRMIQQAKQNEQMQEDQTHKENLNEQVKVKQQETLIDIPADYIEQGKKQKSNEEIPTKSTNLSESEMKNPTNSTIKSEPLLNNVNLQQQSMSQIQNSFNNEPEKQNFNEQQKQTDQQQQLSSQNQIQIVNEPQQLQSTTDQQKQSINEQQQQSSMNEQQKPSINEVQTKNQNVEQNIMQESIQLLQL